MEARKQALAADVVVVNHHLFFADLMLRDEGVSELLPACNTVIFDEAHQLPETASLFFGRSVSTAQLIELARDVRVEAAAGAKDFAALPEAAIAVDRAARDLRLVSERAERASAGACAREPSCVRAGAPRLQRKAAALVHAARVSGRSQRRPRELLSARAGSDAAPRRNGARPRTKTWCAGSELFHHTLQLNATPLSIADVVRRQVDRQRARLDLHLGDAIGERRLRHYQAEMGLDERARGRPGTARSTMPIRRCCTCPTTCRIPMPRATPARWSRPCCR